jgi:DNA-binding beta-propeller fold protein YncE
MSIAVNPVTNKVYVGNQGSTVNVIDGATNAMTNVGSSLNVPCAVAVNPATNKVYAPACGAGSSYYLYVIDGASNTVNVVTLPWGHSNGVVVNPVTNKVYVESSFNTCLMVVDEQQETANGIKTDITSLSASSVGGSLVSDVTLSSSNTLDAGGIAGTYYQVDTRQGQWLSYTNGASNQTGALTAGGHVLYAFSVDGQAATSGYPGYQSSPLIGTMKATWFLVKPNPTTTLSTATNPTNQSPISVTATFSEAVTGFDATDISVANGSVSNFSGSGADYTFDVTPVSQGTVTVSVAAGVAQDAGGYDNQAAAPLAITYDTTAPNATIAGVGSEVVSSFTTTISFDEPVAGLTLSNIVVTNGTASNLANVTPNLVWTVLITSYPGLPVSVSVTGVTDLAGNSNTTTTPLSTTVETTAALNPAAISFSSTGVGGTGDTYTATITNTSAAGLVTLGTITVSGTDPGDFLVSGGTCTNGGAVAAGASCSIAVQFSPTAAGNRSASLTVTADDNNSPHSLSLSGTGTISAKCIVIDPSTPTTLHAGLDGAGVYTSTDSGATWTAATTEPTNKRVKALVIKPGDSTTLYAATYGSGVFVSTDSGDTWSACTNTNLANLNMVSLSIDASGKLYAGTEAGVFTSSDGCATWTAINSGLPN